MAAESSLSRTTTNSQAMRVVLTRPAERQQKLAQHLSQAGCDVLSLPALTITPITPTGKNESHTTEANATETNSTSCHQTTSSGNAEVANWQPGQFDAIVFVSRAAWQNYWQFYLQGRWPVDNPDANSLGKSSVGQTGAAPTTEQGTQDTKSEIQSRAQLPPTAPKQTAKQSPAESPTESPKHPTAQQPTESLTQPLAQTPTQIPLLACVGLATAKQIARDLNLPLSEILYPSPDLGLSPDSEGLWALLEQKLTTNTRVASQQGTQETRQVLIVRGQTGRDWLYDALLAYGISVTCLPVYQREAADWSQAQLHTLKHWAATHHNTGIWLVTSAEGLAAIVRQYAQHGLTGKPGMQPQAVAVVHERLVVPVQKWLGQWSVGSSVPGGAIPVTVSHPDDQNIETAILALRFA